MPSRLRPVASVAAEAILVGDPGRALMLAQELLESPKMSNHARGLWGYWGMTPAGAALTIQSTGMGGPSAGLILTDLAELGVRRAIRVGTCTALGDTLALGDLVAVGEARAWGGPAGRDGEPFHPNARLAVALREQLGAAARVATVASLDIPHEDPADPLGTASCADLQTATLLARGERLGIDLAAVLVVAAVPGEIVLDDETAEEAAKIAGRAAAAALARP